MTMTTQGGGNNENDAQGGENNEYVSTGRWGQ